MFGPVLLVIALKSEKKFLPLITAGTILRFIISIFGHEASHYILLPSLIIMFLFCIYVGRSRVNKALFWGSFIYIITISFQFQQMILFEKDHRLEARDYLLSTTSKEDTSLIENFGMHGFHPPLAECEESLRAKYLAIQEIGGGTGESAKERLNNLSDNCRRVVDLFGQDYLEGSTYEKTWVLTKKDLTEIEKLKPNVLVLNEKLENQDPSFKRIFENYQLVRSFKTKVLDLRLQFLLEKSFYFSNPQYAYTVMESKR